MSLNLTSSVRSSYCSRHMAFVYMSPIRIQKEYVRRIDRAAEFLMISRPAFIIKTVMAEVLEIEEARQQKKFYGKEKLADESKQESSIPPPSSSEFPDTVSLVEMMKRAESAPALAQPSGSSVRS